MKTIYRLILKTYLGPMFLTFFIVMFIFLMNFLWRYIDEIVGKGLGLDVIAELMMYSSLTFIPMALPLATLLASIMTMGSLGENYELLAMKSAGMSLPRIMKPLIILMVFVSIAGFYAGNNLVPFSTRKMSAMLYDIRKQKQEIEFKDGLFTNDIPDMSVRVGHRDKETGLLTDVLIYNYKNPDKMSTTIAQSGYIRLSPDKKFLLVTLYNGESFEQTRGFRWYEDNELTRKMFDVQNMVLSMSGFDFQRTDANLFADSGMENMDKLQQGIDSLSHEATELQAQAYGPLFSSYIFPYDHTLSVDSLRSVKSDRQPFDVADSIAGLDIDKKMKTWADAAHNARNSRSMFIRDESLAKEKLTQLYRYQFEWHNKLALPVSIMIFFLIGAPLGAIIRRGGLGMPIVVSVAFFVIYYLISIMGKQMAREGTWDAWFGSWVSTFILLPIGLFLIYKATNDSNLFNADWYFIKFRKLRDYVARTYKKIETRYGFSKKDA